MHYICSHFSTGIVAGRGIGLKSSGGGGGGGGGGDVGRLFLNINFTSQSLRISTKFYQHLS